MRRLSIAVVAATCTVAYVQIAPAADMPTKAPVAPVAVPYSWTGWYAGINGGYGWRGGDASALVSNGSDIGLFRLFGVERTSTPSFKLSGGLAGLQLGYHYQTHPNWVIGFETDIQKSWIKGEGSAYLDTVFSNPFFGLTPWVANASTEVKWFGTLRARAGYLPTNNLLLYLTGGLAYGRIERSGSVFSTFAPPGSTIASGPTSTMFCANQTNCYVATEKRTELGWTAGAGAEYKVSSNFSVKAEYLYVHFGDQILTLPALQPPSNNAVMFAAFNGAHFNLVRVGLNYKFQ